MTKQDRRAYIKIQGSNISRQGAFALQGEKFLIRCVHLIFFRINAFDVEGNLPRVFQLSLNFYVVFKWQVTFVSYFGGPGFKFRL
jgi:hypothetical protein